MTRLLIQPVANPEAERNRRKTLHHEVDFRVARHWSALTGDQRALLSGLHPGGTAPFWGTRAFLDRRMAEVTVGDVALFAWKGHIRAIGEVGASFRSPAFADTLWKEAPDEDTFVNVYSMIGLDDTVLIPYRTLKAVSGGKLRGPFLQGVVIDDAVVVDQVISGLGIDRSTVAAAEEAREEYIRSQLERGLAIELERIHTTQATYSRSARSITVRRAESLLVHEYAEANPEARFERITSEAGMSDMYTVGSEGAEVVEAKGGISRDRVRQAVAQLLHYAPRCPDRVVRLTALFPARPADVDIELLHSVGIDCVHRTGPGEFAKIPAPAARRVHMLPVWNDDFPE
ncbi:hypothetical protein FHS29_002497 [Saccharothrix tamanrassetensis]|uniref:Uncharacterized protein n=1 Tax=Saccharothrix tamanrassetensis TaxID=1051531 RepID=A0A841CJV7_9PSEU|nr:hypothetical protein [Saccharothrix tamanrassetensis]MBB5955916.1 hypothetical protein [Saccharothrix tamanrassetensis]